MKGMKGMKGLKAGMNGDFQKAKDYLTMDPNRPC